MDLNNWNFFHFFKQGKRYNEYHLISLDIINLYGNIKLTQLYKVISDNIDHLTLEMTKFVCEHNYFTFFNEIYKQNDGIAMGTNAAPELANIYLFYLVDKYIINTWNPNIVFTKRYLDDIFIIYRGTLTEAEYFVSCLQSIKETTNMEFTHRIGKQIEFLDLNIMLTKEGIEFYTHQKKLNKYGYITPSSCHPKHTLSGFINGELTRYAINSSKSIYYKITKNLFYQRLLVRGYQRNYLNDIFQKHTYTNRFSRKPSIQNNSTNLSFRFSKRNGISRLRKSISRVTKLIANKFLENPEISFSWKKSKNLYDILCNSALTEAQVNYINETHRLEH